MVEGALSYSGNGLRDWLVQRISAVVIAAYLLIVVGFWFMHPQADFLVWKGFMGHMVVRVLSLLMLLSLVAHAWIGLWIVSTDYISCTALRLPYQAIVILLLLGYFAWGIEIFWGIV
jgi:succinate dehydrogenase / fumarate reductase membrane anchor subunit